MVDSGESFAFVFRLFGLGKEREDINILSILYF